MSYLPYGGSTMNRIGPKKPFRHYIHEWIQHRDLDGVRMAGRMDVEPGTISKLLSGKMRLSDKWLVGFAEALDVEVIDLFRDPRRPTREELLAGLSEDDVQKVIQIIEVMKGGRTGTDG